MLFYNLFIFIFAISLLKQKQTLKPHEIIKNMPGF